MANVLLIIQIILSVLITGAILLQSQGAGFGSSWSGGGETYHTRRGLEKIVFYLTIVMAVAFALNGILILMV